MTMGDEQTSFFCMGPCVSGMAGHSYLQPYLGAGEDMVSRHSYLLESIDDDDNCYELQIVLA